MSKLREIARGVSSSVGGLPDQFEDVLVENKDEIKKFLDSCGDCDVPCPDIGIPATDAELKAWKDAHNLKVFAGKATDHHKKQIAHHIKRGKRKDGNPIKEAEAESLSSSLISAATGRSQQDIQAALLE